MNLFFRESGRGEPVILLHGLFGCSDNWMSIARRIGETYRVISVDLRNHGNSPHYPTHTYHGMVSDIVALFEELSIEKAHIIGHSMGGKVAMAFTADYPEKTISLAVADIAPKNYQENRIETLEHQTILNSLLSIDLGKYGSRKAVELEISENIEDPFVVSFIMKNLKKESSGYGWKINVPVLKEYLSEIVGGTDYAFFDERLPIFHYPVLFIRGGLSGYIKEEDIPLIRKIYPDSRIETIEGATHYLHAEKPDEFISCYLNFLGTI